MAAVDAVEGDRPEELIVEVEAAEAEGRWGRETKLLAVTEEREEGEGDGFTGGFLMRVMAQEMDYSAVMAIESIEKGAHESLQQRLWMASSPPRGTPSLEAPVNRWLVPRRLEPLKDQRGGGFKV